MNFSKLKLSHKLILGYAVIVVFAASVGVVGILKIKQIDAADTTLYEKGALPLSYMGEAAIAFQRIRVNLRDVARTQGDTQKQKIALITDLEKQLNEELAKVQSTLLTEEGKKAFADLKKDQEEFFAIGTKMVELVKMGKTQIAYEVMDGEGFKANQAFQKALDALQESKVHAAKTIAGSNNEIANSATVTMISLLVIGTLIAAILAALIIRQITNALNNISDNISERSGQIRSASEQLSTASQSLASSSNEQASAVEETSASMEEIGGMVENNLRASERSAESADSVKNQMGSLTNAMSDILAANEKIAGLVKIIGEIGEKTKVIDEIVFQTKLLSFNASVEAERAGEHGRGFAVVAQEVGNLAQMSGKSALEIAAIVKDSLKEAETIVEENKRKVDNGNRITSEAQKIAQQVAQDARQIVTASKEQAEGIKQVNNAISQISKATQENAQFSEETSSSANHLLDQAGGLEEAVVELQELVDGAGSKEHRSPSPVRASTHSAHHNAHATGAPLAKVLHKPPAKAKPALKAVDKNHVALKATGTDGGGEWEAL